MTVEEFIEDYSWERAKEVQAEMLAKSSRRPDEWTYVERIDESSTAEYTIFMEFCPFRLKSKKMTKWIRDYLLFCEALWCNHGFSVFDSLKIGCISIADQLDGNYWSVAPIHIANCLAQWILRLGNYEDEFDLMVQLKERIAAKVEARDQPEPYNFNCWSALLLCCLHIVDLSLRIHEITDHTFAAMSQLQSALNDILDDLDEDCEFPDFTLEAEAFEGFIKLIPTIEESGNEELIRMAYEFARDFYKSTRRFKLAEKFEAKLNGE